MIHAVALVVVRNHHVLAVRKSVAHRWILPGGKPKPSESDLDTLCRKVREELAVGVRGPVVQWLGIFEGDSSDIVGLDGPRQAQVHCWTGELDGEPTPSAKIAELTWLPLWAKGEQTGAAVQWVLRALACDAI